MQNTPKRNSFFIPEGKYAINTTALSPRAVEQEAAVLLAGKARDSFYGLVPLDTTAEEDTRSAALTLAKGITSSVAQMLLLSPYRQMKTLWRLADDRMAKGNAFWDELRQMPKGKDAQEAAGYLARRLPDLQARYDAARERSLQAVRDTRKKQERFLETMHLTQDEKDNPYVYMFGEGAGSLGASVLGGIYFKAPKAVSVLFGLNQAQNAWEEATENGVPRAKAAGVALLAGSAETLLESVGLGRLEKAFEASKGVIRIIGSALTEFLQEGAQQSAEEIIMQNLGGRAQSAFETFKSIAISAVMGAVLGGGAGAIHSAFFSGAKRFEQLGADKETARALAAKAVETGISPKMAEEAARITEDQENPVNWPDNDIIKGQQELRAAAKKRDFAKEYDDIEARAKAKFKASGLSEEEAAIGASVSTNIVQMQAAHLGLTPDLAEKRLEISFNQELSESEAKIRFIDEIQTLSSAEQEAFYKTSKTRSYTEMLGELAAFRAGLNEETAPINGLDSGSTAGMTTEGDSGAGGAQRAPMTAQEEETSLQTGNEELSEENIFDLQTQTRDYSYDKPLERGQTRNKQISITREEDSQVGRTVTFRFLKEIKASKSDLVGERQVSATEDNNILSWLEIPEEYQREIAVYAHKVNIKRIVLVENPGNMNGFKGMYAVVEYEAVGSKHLGTTRGIMSDYTMLGKPTPALFKKLSGELKTAQKGKKKENGQTVTFAQGENKNTSAAVDLTDDFADINKKSSTDRAAEVETALKALIGRPMDTATPPLQIQVTAENKVHIKNANVPLKKGQLKRHQAALKTLEKIVNASHKIEKDGTVDTSHNTNRKTLAHKQQVEEYVYFEAPIKLGQDDFVVELAAERVKGRKSDLLDLYNVRVKRGPTSAHLSTLTQGPYTNNIENKEGKVKGETYQQDQKETAPILDSGSTAGMTAGVPRGKTAITSKDGFVRAIITAGQSADKSTFVHEMAHIYLSVFQHVYGMEEYAAQRKRLDQWLGKPRGGVYSRAQQEKFAQGFEQFLKEGKAPVPYLKSIFEKFRAWIIRVYDGVDIRKLSDAAREAYADMFRSEAADAQQTVEFYQNAKKDYGRIRATLEKIKQDKISVKDLDGVDVEALRDFVGILKKPAPALPKRHLLTDLRRYGAQYANSGRIDKEAYKNARVYNKETGVGDKPADWLVQHGYMEDGEANTYEEAQARDEAAWNLIDRALSGEPVYKLEDMPRVELHDAYREAVNMAEDAIGADYKNYEKLLTNIDELVKQGYRVVEKSDLAFMEEKFEELANLRESEAFLAQEESFGRVDDVKRGSADERRKEKTQKARLENLRKAQSLKKAVLEELAKRRLFSTTKTESSILDSGSTSAMTAQGETQKTATGKLQNMLPPDAKPVAKIDAKQLGFSGTIKEIKTKLIQWYKDNLQGTSAVNPELGKVAFTRAGISEVKGKALTQQRACLVTAAKSVIEKGTVVGEHAEEKHPQGIKKFYFVQGKVELDGAPVIMQVDVAEDGFGKKFYYVSEIQKNTKGFACDQNTGSLGATDSITQNSDIVKAQNPLATARQELENAQTVEEIYKGIDHALGVIEDAYANSEAGKAEAGRMAPPAQDWDARRVELLKKLSEINQKTDDNAAWAFAAIEREGRIVPHKSGISPEEWNVPAAVSEKQRKMNVWKAEQILDEQLRNRYYKAFEEALGKTEGLKAPQKAILLREFNNIRYRNKNVPELIVKTLESAREYVEKNYKAYMAGKIADMIKTPLFEKSGSLRTAKYSPAAQEFLKAAHRIVTLDEQVAQDSYQLALDKQHYDEDLTKAQILQNRLLQLRAAPETMTAADVKELYDDVNELRKAGRDEVRLEKFLRNTREDIMREWLITALAKQKTVLGAVTYVKKLANWQSILNTLFGELEVDAEINGQMGKRKIRFMDELSLEQNQIQMQNHVKKLRLQVVERFGEAYGIKSGNEYIKKINELQSETYTFDNYGEIPEGPQELLTERQRKPFKQTITKLELMFFWIQNQNTLNKLRLMRAYREEQYAVMFEPLSAADKKAAAALMEIAQSTYGQMNEVHKRERGFTLGRVENYFPNRTEKLTGGLDYLREMLANNAAPSAVKSRVQTVLAVEKPVNPVALLMGEISRNAEYIYGAESAGKLRRIFRDKQMARALEEKFGKKDGRDIYEHIIKMIDLNGPNARIKEKNQFFETMEFLFNNWVKSAIGLKPIVAVKQFASSFNYAENMPVAAWAAGFKDALAHPQETLRFMQEFSPYLVTRYEEGGMNETLGRALSKDDTFGTADKINTITNALTVNVRLGDKFALAFGGKPYVDWLMKKKGYTKEQARVAFELATVRSQQANLKSTLNEAQLNGGNLFWRAAWAFRNQQMQYARKLFDAYVDWKNGYISDGELAKKVFMYAIVQPALYTLLSLGWFAKDDDDRKDDWWRLAASPVEQTLGAVPFGDDLTELLFSNLRSLCSDGKLTGMREYELPSFADMTRSFNKFVKNFNAGDASLNDWLDALAEIGQFSGFGTKQIKTQLGGVKDVITGKPVKGAMKIIGYTENRAKKVTGDEDE